MSLCIQCCKSLWYLAGTTRNHLRNHLREKWFPTRYDPKGRRPEPSEPRNRSLSALLASRRRISSAYGLPSRTSRALQSTKPREDAPNA